jgi:amino acid adenylation domain-containing protein
MTSDRSERLKHLSPAKRALLLRALQREQEPAAIPRLSGPGPYELSFSQQRLWFLDQVAPGSAAYNVPFGLRLAGPLDREALAAALSEIVRRHEVLRSTFELVGERPVQVVGPPRPFELPVRDLRGLEGGHREEEIRRLSLKEARRPFDLARGPVIRASLLRLGEHEHIVQLTMHHIVCDGWSDEILLREIVALYRAFSSGLPSPLPELRIQYSDFAAWQRRELSGERLEKLLSYWRGQLTGAPALLELPADRVRPAVRRARGERIPVSLPPALGAGLAELGRSRGATLFMVLLAGLDVLLGRLSGQTDLVVGTPVAGRDRLETEDLIGVFINMLALRATVRDELSFHELLAEVQRNALDAFAHQELPFDRLVEELRLAHSESHTPVFQVMLAFQTAARRTERAGSDGFVVEGLPLSTGTAKLDLTFELAERTTGRIEGEVEYDADLFDEPTVRLLWSHFERLLAGAVADPGRPVAELPLLSEAERHQVLGEWNDTAAELCEEAWIHQAFEARAERTPEAPAVSFGSETISYRELDRRANRLAHHLRAVGAVPGGLVGVCLDRSLDLVITLLAVLKAGAAYVPIDPGYPEERRRFMLTDSGVPVLVAGSTSSAAGVGFSGRLVRLDLEREEIEAQNADRPGSTPTGGHPAYMIYTSGSTGRPKGALNTHRGILNRLLWMQETFRLEASDAVLQKTPFSFDVSVWEFFWPLMVGARLVVARPGGHQDPTYLADLIAREAITTVHFVPSMLQAFLEEPGIDRCRALRRVICSGEALPASLAERHHQRLGAQLFNLYGPTEAAVDVTTWSCLPGSAAPQVPIGRPVTNTILYVLDSRFEPVPIGRTGELYIGGIQLATGYWGRSELTAEKFVPHPFPARPGERVYRTGDLARFRPDGAIVYQGRTDHQVKVRGFRIELGEIETALLRHPAVRDAAVLVFGGPETGGARLVAYFVPEAGTAPEPAELAAFLSADLPGYMVPALFLTLAELPLSPNGKLDRRALPAPDGARPASGNPYVAPRTPLERLLSEIWAGVLQLERVGIDDGFFALGGDSMRSLQVIARGRGAGLDLTLEEIYRNPTIRALAERREGAAPESLPMPGETDVAELELLVREIAGLSDEEVLAHLGSGEPGEGRFERD